MQTHIFVNSITKQILVVAINDLETAKQVVFERFKDFVYKYSIKEQQIAIISPNE